MKEFEQTIKQFLEERGWHKLRPSNLAKSIMIEGAELLEIFQWDNQTVEEVKANPEKMAEIKKELADVMIYCFDLAVTLDLDVQEILTAKLEKIKAKYPTDQYNPNNMPEEPGTEAQYWETKKQHRRDT